MIKAGFDLLCADTSTDIVVLAGDTTRDGELALTPSLLKCSEI